MVSPASSPEDFPHLVRIAASRVPGPKTQERVATAAEAWIRTHEADDEPDAPSAAGAPNEDDALLAGVRQGSLRAEDLLQGYCARVYAQTGSYEEAGRKLDLHWQTVRNNVRALEGAGARRRGELTV